MRIFAKILNIYVTFHLHPWNLDGISASSENFLKEFGFLDVINVIVDAMTTIANQATSLQPPNMLFATVSKIMI